MALANTMFKQHQRQPYTWTSPDGNTRNQIDYITIAQRCKKSLTNSHTYPGADCDTDHQLLMVTLKVRLVGRWQRQHSIPPLNVEEVKEEKAVQFASEMTNRFTALEAAQDEVTPEDRRPWLVDIRCGPPTPEPCMFQFHGLILPSAPGTLQWLAHVYRTHCCLNCKCWTVLSAPLRWN